jgi:hypothetical protein
LNTQIHDLGQLASDECGSFGVDPTLLVPGCERLTGELQEHPTIGRPPVRISIGHMSS